MNFFKKKQYQEKKWEGQDKSRSKLVNRVICTVARNGKMRTRIPEAVVWAELKTHASSEL
jgi:hypothetical protein